jgi:dihydroorotate dehydrogenase electron transfer subunit
MTSSLHAAYYADRAVQRTVEIVENVRLARDTYRLRFACPEIAGPIVPGQFVMLRMADVNDPLIGRPLALYQTTPDDTGRPHFVDVVYLVKGKFTSRVVHARPGERLTVWGPLGNGFSVEPVEHLIMVAGGIGQTPFLALAEAFLGHRAFGDPPRSITPAKRVTFCYGARSADLLAGLDDFTRAGVELRIATDDGTRGHHGLVTDLLREVLREQPDAARRIAVCGPEPMMAAVARIAEDHRTPCEVSLETPMACGIGICFTCVAKVRDAAGAWDYQRTCVAGPVFDAARIEW